MGDVTKIQWADHTWNPWRGCTKVSPGCANCYAEQQSRRNPGVLGEWGPEGKRVIAAESYWNKPFAWNREAARWRATSEWYPQLARERPRVFSLSFGDWLEDREDTEVVRMRMLRIIQECQDLDWLLLTKRPQHFRTIMERIVWRLGGPASLFGKWVANWLDGSPPPNVWLGVSVEDQKRADERLPVLLTTPARVRWVSYEPALGPVDFTPWLTSSPRLDWIVVGGESGPGARPFKIDWAHRTIEQCKANGVAVYMKQMGARPYREGNDWTTCFDGSPVWFALNDPKGGDPAEWAEYLRVREFPR